MEGGDKDEYREDDDDYEFKIGTSDEEEDEDYMESDFDDLADDIDGEGDDDDEDYDDNGGRSRRRKKTLNFLLYMAWQFRILTEKWRVLKPILLYFKVFSPVESSVHFPDETFQ